MPKARGMRISTVSIAASVSVLVHLAALAPDWHVQDNEASGSKPISAVLLAAPAAEPAVAPDVVPKPKPKPRPDLRKPPPIADAPTAALGDQPHADSMPAASEAAGEIPPAVATAQSAAIPEIAASAVLAEAQSPPLADSRSAPLADTPPQPPASLADLSNWARQGRIRYVSSYYGLPISGEQTWSHDDKRFSASLRGSVPIKGELIKQVSSGRITTGRPVSESFTETFNSARYETRFDAAGNKVQQVRKGDARDVETGGYALDMLALTHFMGLQPVGGQSFDVFVVTFRGSVSRVTIEQRAARVVELPVGMVNARQFHAEARNGSLKIDIWLAVDWRNAPVRIRVEDAGGTYDLKAEEVEVEGQIVGSRPPTSRSSD
ncbi:MAG: hypothetical protein JWL63_1351 [Rhodocyclales bacterium]|nr:hypothetical protein [Rhodocyclales bacterium]